MTKTEESNPWWLITFKSFSRVYEVFIASRSDRCGKWLKLLKAEHDKNKLRVSLY